MSDKTNRWHTAQKHEREWWERTLQTIDFSYFKSYAHEVKEQIRGIIEIDERTRILEIGAGPAGILTHLHSRFRFGMDPLELFYETNDTVRRNRDGNVHYLAAQGEYLPYSDNSFDFIIIDNILDHCENVDAVFKEMSRVLAPYGIVYLRNLTYTRWGIAFANLLELFAIDRGHPFHFREADLRRLFDKYTLEPVSIKRRGFLRHNLNLLTSKKISPILRALSLSHADKVAFVLRNSKDRCRASDFPHAKTKGIF